MKTKLILLSLVLTLISCSSTPKKETAVVTTAVHPFVALDNTDKVEQEWEQIDYNNDKKLSRSEFKDNLLIAYSAADNHDGKMDGKVSLKACSGNTAICQIADSNKDEVLTLEEFLNRADVLFDKYDLDKNGVLDQKEITKLESAPAAL
jgi:uncharacterized membrane protein